MLYDTLKCEDLTWSKSTRTGRLNKMQRGDEYGRGTVSRGRTGDWDQNEAFMPK